MKIKDGFYMTEIGSDYVIIAGTPEAKKLFGGMLRLNETGAFLYRGNRILRSSSYSHGNFLLRHTRRTVPPPVCVNGPVPGRVLPDEEC